MTQRTPLYDWHVAQRAQMTVFGDYAMPLWYPSGARQEHLAVLTAAGLFDTCHMAVVFVDGPGAFALLQYTFTKDLAHCLGPAKGPLLPGRCAYGVFLNARGHVLDDAIVYMLGEDRFLVVVNSGQGADITAHLRAQVRERQVRVTDLTGRVGKVDLQGPAAARILAPLLQAPEETLKNVVYLSFKGGLTAEGSFEPTVRCADGIPILLSRTGYTGEFGFEILLPPDQTPAFWEMLMNRGRSQGLLACGLAARDTLRAGAGLPLARQDIGPWPFTRHPWPFALPLKEGQGFTKVFLGDQALLQARDADYTYPFVGFDPRKVSPHDPALVLAEGDAVIGRVLTCAVDMGIGRAGGRVYSIASADRPAGFAPAGLACGLLKVSRPLDYGREVRLKDHKRTLPVVIVREIRPDRTARRPIKDMLP